MKRHEARQKALQALFQIDFSEIPAMEAMENVLDGQEVKESFFSQLVLGVCDHLLTIDECLRTHLESWSIERIGNVDRTILRLATYEMMYSETPHNVSINEALELAKVFSDEKSSRFINGVLSKVKKSLETQQ